MGGKCGGDLIEDASKLLLQVVKVLEPVGKEDVVDLLAVVADVVRAGLLLRVGGAGVVRIVVLLDGIRERAFERRGGIENISEIVRKS